MVNHEDPIEARRELIATANMLRQVLYNLNVYGDTLTPNGLLATQCDGCAYGEVNDGFRILLRVLYPDDGVTDRDLRISDALSEGDSDTTVEEAAQWVADKHAPEVSPHG
jgi:hypothetical protein